MQHHRSVPFQLQLIRHYAMWIIAIQLGTEFYRVQETVTQV